MEAFLMMGENYIGDPALGRACHNRRKNFDLAFEAAGLKETRRAFYRALAEAGLGREAVVIAVKPMSARPFFIVSSRAAPAPPCCTRRLSAVPGVEMHHEYMVQITQPLAVQRYLGLVGAEEAAAILARNPWRGHPLQPGRALGRFLQQAVLADSRSGGAVSRRALRPSGARRPQGRRAPISTSWATNVTTTAPPRFCRRI